MRKTIAGALVGVLVSTLAGIAAASPASAAGKLTTATCANVIIIGARGSGESASSSSTAIARFGTRTTGVAKKIAAGLSTSTTYRYEGLDYPAVSANVWTAFISGGGKGTAMKNSVAAGRDKLVSRINTLKTSCPSSRLVLIGYSQGAWVIHEALASYKENNSRTSRVFAAVLLADPANVGSKYYTLMTDTAGKATGADPSKVKGLVSTGSNWNSTLQDWSTTISICSNRDIVCSVGSKSGTSSHSTTYNTANVWTIGANYALARIKASNRNGVCDAGEFCAYKDSGKRTLILDVNVPKGYKRIDVLDDVVSSVWNRSSNTWTARNQRTGLADQTLATIKAGVTTNASSSWNDKTDHFNVS